MFWSWCSRIIFYLRDNEDMKWGSKSIAVLTHREFSGRMKSLLVLNWRSRGGGEQESENIVSFLLLLLCLLLWEQFASGIRTERDRFRESWAERKIYCALETSWDAIAREKTGKVENLRAGEEIRRKANAWLLLFPPSSKVARVCILFCLKYTQQNGIRGQLLAFWQPIKGCSFLEAAR